MSKQLTVIQPVWSGLTGAELETRSNEFWAEVDADPCTVVVVAVFDGSSMDLAGVFSTFALAASFAAAHEGPAMIVPKRLDEPHWGNTEIQ